MKVLNFNEKEWNTLNSMDVGKFNNYNMLTIEPAPRIASSIAALNDSYVKGEEIDTALHHFINELNAQASELSLEGLGAYDALNDWIVELQWIVEDPIHDSLDYLEAQFKSFSELISSYLFYLFVKKNLNVTFHDNRDFFMTDHNYENPTMDMAHTEKRLEALDMNQIHIFQAHLASTDDNNSSIVKGGVFSS